MWNSDWLTGKLDEDSEAGEAPNVYVRVCVGVCVWRRQVKTNNRNTRHTLGLLLLHRNLTLAGEDQEELASLCICNDGGEEEDGQANVNQLRRRLLDLQSSRCPSAQSHDFLGSPSEPLLMSPLMQSVGPPVVPRWESECVRLYCACVCV